MSLGGDIMEELIYKSITYVVLSRDDSRFVFVTQNKESAETARKNQEREEELAGGKPSVYIKETKLKY